MSAENPSPSPERSKPRQLIDKLGKFTREQFRRSKPGAEIPMPDGLHTRSGGNPHLEPTNLDRKRPERDYKKFNYLGPGEKGVPRAIDYAEKIFPGKQFDLLSSKGSQAVVLESGDKVFKVMRDGTNYSSFENEVGALQTLASEGLAPKLHLMVDAGKDFRLNMRGARPNSFSDIQVPRINEEDALPIIVMDKINAKPLDTLTDDQRIAAFDTFLEAGSRLDLAFGDTEFIVDGDTDRVVVIDTGGIRRDGYKKYGVDDDPTYDHYPGLTEEEVKAASLTQDLLMHLSRVKPPTVQQIAEYLKNDDTAQIYAILTKPSDRPLETEYNYQDYKPIH
jgi:hypothetical protein